MVYHMKSLILKAVIIGGISIDKPNQNVKFIRIHFFYNTVVIPFPKEGDDTVKRCIFFCNSFTSSNINTSFSLFS